MKEGCEVRGGFASPEAKEHTIRPNRPIWVVIAALALGAVVQAVGCATPEQRHRVLTVFFDGVPPLHPPEPAETFGEPVDGGVQRIALFRESSRDVSVHGPVAKKECDQCHASRYSNRLKQQKEDLCWSCHDREDFAGAVIHGPVSAGFCNGCHDPHRSRYPSLLVMDKAELCRGCHVQFDVTATAAHQSAEVDACQSCHDPHAADRKYMLKRDEESS